MGRLRLGLAALTATASVLAVAASASAQTLIASDNSVQNVDISPGSFATVKNLPFALAEPSEVFVRYDVGQSHDCCHHQLGALEILVDGSLEIADSVPFVVGGGVPGPNYKVVGPVSIGAFGAGSHTAELRLGDAGRNTIFELYAEPLNEPPVCSGVVANQTTLWPPNHRMVPISVGGATDPDGDALTLTITGVTQDEPVNEGGDGNIAPDAQLGPASSQVGVRAERSGGGDGRVYRVAFTVTDPAGASCGGQVVVSVPHNQRPGAIAVDSGDVFDSLAT